MELKIEYIDIDSIKPYENNPRHNEEAIPYVMNSIKKFGFKNPIIIDKNNVIIAGHTRLESAKRLGMKEVPIIHADDLTEEQVKAFRLADNKVSEKSQWNFELLDEELEDILNINMDDFGFEKLLSIEDIDEEELNPEEPIAKELDEANNYIVLEFNTKSDWERAEIIFGLERVATADDNKNIRRYGIGRVIDGKEVMERISE